MGVNKTIFEIEFKGKDFVSGIVKSISSKARSTAAQVQDAIRKATSAPVTSPVVSSINNIGAAAISAAAKAESSFNKFTSSATVSAGRLKQAVDDAYVRVQKGGGGEKDWTEEIRLQQNAIRGLKLELEDLQRAKQKALSNLERKNLTSSIQSKQDELKLEEHSLKAMQAAQKQYAGSTTSLRTQLMNLRNEMGALALAGKQETEEYTKKRAELERLGTAYRRLQSEQQALSTGATQWGGIINGMQGLIGLYSAGSGVMSLFIKDNEKLMAVQAKMQSVMAIMIGMQQVSNTLHVTSAFRITTVRKVKELWTVATKAQTAASLGLRVATLGLVGIAIGALIIGLSKVIKKNREVRAEYEKSKKLAQEYAESVSQSAAGQIVSFLKLKKAWDSLGNNIKEKGKFIRTNKKEFENLGISVNSMTEAENAFEKNTQKIIGAMMARAQAAAAMQLAEKLYAEQMMNENARQVERTKIVKYKQVNTGATIKVGDDFILEKKLIIDEEATERAREEIDAKYKILDETLQKRIDNFINTGVTKSKEAETIFKKMGLSVPGEIKADSLADYADKIDILKSRLQNASASERAALQKDINTWQEKIDKINEGLQALSVEKDPRSLDKINKAISFNEQLLGKAEENDRSQIQRTINALKQKKTAIEDALKGLEVERDPQTLEELNTAIAYYEYRISKANTTELAGLQTTVEGYKKKKKEIENTLTGYGISADPQTINELSAAIAYQQTLLGEANASERIEIQKTIDQYEKKKKTIEDLLALLSIPANPQTLEEYTQVISALESKLQKASDAERANIQSAINTYTRKKEAIEKSLLRVGMSEDISDIGIPRNMELSLQLKLDGIEYAQQEIQKLKKMLSVTKNPDEVFAIKGAIKDWDDFIKKTDYATYLQGKMTEGLEAVGAMGQIVGKIAGENTAQWIDWGINLISAISKAIPWLVSLITGNIANAATGAAASVAGVPFAGPALAVAAAGSIVSALATIPKFATGGIAYGPTLGLFGEYAGASSNPEVVAPLDRLRTLIQPSGYIGGDVRFIIEQDKLVGILSSYNKKKKYF